MNKQQLAAKIWASANQMRSKIEANEYKDYILGFIFYKFLSEKELSFLKANGATLEDIKQLSEEDPETVQYIQSNIGYFIAYKDLYSTWLSMGSDFSIANVREGLNSFDRLIDVHYKNVFDGIFKTLQAGLSKLGESAGAQSKSARNLLYLIKDIPMDGKQDYDVLGFVYEYLISNFAANAGKKAGEFYTPNEVSLVISEIVADHLKDKDEIQIYDSTSGSGSLLINIGKSVQKHMKNPDNIKYYAQELKENTYNLTRMNLVMQGILPSNITVRNGDTLLDDYPFFDDRDPVGTYNPVYTTAVVGNPPYSQEWDPKDRENDPRYARFGLAPKGKADYAFLLHDLYHVKPDGIMAIILPHGVLFRGGEEGVIRKNLIENNHIDAIIGFPSSIFYGTSIPTVLIVLKQKRDNTDVLIVDASKHFKKVAKNNVLRASDIKRIVDTVTQRKETLNYSRIVSQEEIRQNDYNLNIPRYVDSSEKPESWDLYASMNGGIPKKEIDDFNAYWEVFPTLRHELFDNVSEGYSTIRGGDVKQFIQQHPEVRRFKELYADAFSGLQEELHSKLINEKETLPILKTNLEITQDLFDRLERVPLVDPYTVYEALTTQWAMIATDLEIIQTEGVAAIKVVDPYLEPRKKNDKEEDVQKGWMGRILPFELVQKECLPKELKHLQEKEAQLVETIQEQESIFESLSEDDQQVLKEALNEDNSAFVPATLIKVVKQFLKDQPKASYSQDSAEGKAIAIKELSEKEKMLKKEIKELSEDIHLLTKTTIESLDEDQVTQLLSKKWIFPFFHELYQIPEVVLNQFENKMQALSTKYETTLLDIEIEIQNTEKSLAKMLNQLTGSESNLQGIQILKDLLGE